MAVLNITSENYEKEVVGSKLPVLLDFWAPWCKYCRRIAPVVERVDGTAAVRSRWQCTRQIMT